MTEDNNINKLFRDVFENLEVTPPVSVKMEIDKQLGPKRKFRFIFWWLPVVLLLLGGIAFAVIRSGLNESENQSRVVSQFNDTSVGNSSSSLDHTSENSSASHVSKSDRNEKQNENDKKNEKQDGSSDELSVIVDQRGTKQQQLTLKKGNTLRSNQNESVAEEKGGTSKSGKIKKNAKSGQSTKGTKRAVSNMLKSGTGSKRTNDASGDSKQQLDSEQTNLSGSPQNTEPIDAKSTQKEDAKSPKDKSVKNEPSDSLQKADTSTTAAKTDSLSKPLDETSKVKPTKDESKAKKWMLELYGGPRFGAKTSKTDFVLKEATSYQIGLGFSRNLELGPLKYLTLDGEYGSGKESYKQNITTNTVYFVGIDSIPYFDTITDTVPAGYTYYNNYDTTTSTIENTQNSTITRFAFGLKAQFNFDLGAGFGLAVVPGYYYSVNKFKFSDSGSVSTSSSQILLGLGVYYDWNRFRFRVGLDTRYELMRKNNNLFIDRRKSLLFLPQFGIAFKF